MSEIKPEESRATKVEAAIYAEGYKNGWNAAVEKVSVFMSQLYTLGEPTIKVKETK